MRLPSAFGALLLAGAAAAGACTPNPYKDSHCSPDSPSITVDANCIYAGNGKGPSFKQPVCPAPSGNPPAKCPTFDDVFNMMTDFDSTTMMARKRGGCTATACHGDPSVDTDGIFLDAGDPMGFYTTLTSIKGTVGRPYVVPDDPSTPDNEALTSWIQCNVAGLAGGGYPMPEWSGLTSPLDATASDDIQLVDDWILCGAPGPK